MPKIKLKALRLPRTDGLLQQPVDRTVSGTDFIDPNDSGIINVNNLYYQVKTGVLSGVRLGVEYNIWVELSELGDIEVYRGDRFLINITTFAANLPIENIEWQEDTIVKITFETGTNMSRILINDFLIFINSTNSENDGIYQVTDVNIKNEYVLINNANRTDDTKDEIGSPSEVSKAYRTYEVQDIKEELFSRFRDHYEINLRFSNG